MALSSDEVCLYLNRRIFMMNLKLSKKSIKKLTADKNSLPVEATPRVGGAAVSEIVCNSDGICWTQRGNGNACEIYSHDCH